LKAKYGFKPAPSDIDLNNNASLNKLIIFGLVGGSLGTAFGIGGGAVYNPLLMSLGQNPLVATASGMYMVMFSTIAATMLFVVFGMLKFNYALWLALWSCIGIAVSIGWISKIINRSGRASILVYCLSAFLLFAMAMGLYYNTKTLEIHVDQG